MKRASVMVLASALTVTFAASAARASPMTPTLIDCGAALTNYVAQFGPASGEEEDSGVMVLSPRPYQVIQRDNGAGSVTVRLAQAAAAPYQVEVRTHEGTTVCEGSIPAGQAEVTIANVPEGGWHTLVLKSGEKELAGVPFGIGDVFVVAGQSNAGGNGDGFIPDRSGMVSVKAYEGDEWLLVTQMDERLHPEMHRGSPWPVLGELLVTAWRVPIGFINVARGGSNTDQWLPANGDLYPRLPAVLKAYKVRAILWHQGESDAASGWPTEKTRANMETIIRQSWQDAGWRAPWYVAFVSFVPGLEQEKMDATRQAQREICDAGLALPGPDTDKYVDPNTMRHDRLHFNQVGLRIHAMLWFMTLTWGASPNA